MCCVLTSSVYDSFSYKVYIIRSFQVDENIKIFRIVMLFSRFFFCFFFFCRDLASETWIFKRLITKQNSATKVNKAVNLKTLLHSFNQTDFSQI